MSDLVIAFGRLENPSRPKMEEKQYMKHSLTNTWDVTPKGVESPTQKKEGNGRGDFNLQGEDKGRGVKKGSLQKETL